MQWYTFYWYASVAQGNPEEKVVFSKLVGLSETSTYSSPSYSKFDNGARIHSDKRYTLFSKASFEGKPLFPNLSLFGVKYGKPKSISGSKKASKLNTHKNSADKIIGIILDLKETDFKRVAKFSGEKSEGQVISNPYGFHFIQFEALKDRTKYFKEKLVNHKAVILRIKNLAKFKKHTKFDYSFKFYGQSFYGVKQGKLGWDILFTESDKFASSIKKGHTLFPLVETERSSEISKTYN